MLNHQERTHLIAELLKAKRELDMLTLDEDMTDPPAKPATPKEVDRFEKECGFAIDPSYREFLLLHNGWTDFDGDAAILGTKGKREEWFDETIEMIWEVFEDFGDENPVDGAVPIVLGEDTNNYLFMWPPREGTDKAVFKEYEDGKLVQLFADFDEYLAGFLKSLLHSIEVERDGAVSDDDDQE